MDRQLISEDDTFLWA